MGNSFELSTPLGTLTGTVSVSGGLVTFTMTGATGVYAGQVPAGTQFTVRSSGGRAVASTAFRNHGAYVSAVAHAAAQLSREGRLPAGIKPEDLGRLAARNEQALLPG